MEMIGKLVLRVKTGNRARKYPTKLPAVFLKLSVYKSFKSSARKAKMAVNDNRA